MIYAIVWFLFGIICYWIADFNKEKHNIGSPIAWFFAGILFGVFTLIVESIALVVVIGRGEDT